MDQSETCQQWWLPHHIHACRTEAGTVLLDLRRGKYFGIANHESRALHRVVGNWPAQRNAGTQEIPQLEATQVAAKLAAAKLLDSKKPAEESLPAATVVVTQNLESVGDNLCHRTPLTIPHVGNFILACLWALVAIRLRSFESIARGLAATKAGHTDTMGASEMGALVSLVGIFRMLRPFAFTAHDHCLFHALALVRFLNIYGCYPTWVIGVRTTPWGAHSWAQQNNLILDTTPEKIVEFTPIFAV